MKISNSYTNELWNIFNTSSANTDDVASGQNSLTKLASGDTVLISDEARQLLSEALQKYSNGELNQNNNASADSLLDASSTDNIKIEDGNVSSGNQSGGSAGGSSGTSDSESIKKQIEKLQGQLQSLIGQLGGNSADASISAKIAAIQSQIAALQAQLTA